MNNNSAKKNFYYAFFDAEYTCYMESDSFFDREHSGELLSVGVVICDKKFNVIRTYYSPIHPRYNPRLTKYCRSLTGLTQKEIDEAPSYETVFQELHLLFQEYPVKEIFTWGNDSHTLFHDIEKNHKNVARRHKRITGLLRDITKRLTKKVFGKGMSLSLSDMKYICGMEYRIAHNALEDARDLYMVTKCCLQGKYDREKTKKLQKYICRRDIYHQYRRFKKFLAPEVLENKKEKKKNKEYISDKTNLKKISIQYIEEVKKCFKDDKGDIPAEILALCDDVRSLAGLEAQECPKLE